MVKVYELTGRLIFEGRPSDFEGQKAIFQNRVLVYAYYNEKGQFLFSKKHFRLITQ